MKKIICCVLCFVLMFSVNAYSSSYRAEDLLVKNNEMSYTGEYKNDYNSGGFEYYPFIYSARKKWFIENIIGPTNCREGYLYSKEYSTGIIRQLVSQPVNVFAETKDGVYFIHDNIIYFVDYKGTDIKKVYQSNKILDEKVLRIDGQYLLFTENNNLVRFDKYRLLLETISKGHSPDMIYVRQNNEYVFSEDNVFYYVKDVKTIEIYSEMEIRYLLDTSNSIMTSYFNNPVQIDSNFDTLLNEYPFGSYFTNDGGPCGHHGTGCSYNNGCNCKAYHGSIQCMAYARYGSDKYAHLSGWNPKSNDEWEDYEYMDGGADVATFFANTYSGAYVRISRVNYGYGYHSVLYVGMTSTNIITYECNWSGVYCEVSYQNRSLANFASIAPYIIYVVSHTFEGSCISSGSSYHKQYCSTSGCNGWRYEGHYSSSPGANTTCSACGYFGSIYLTGPLGY